MNRKKQVKLLKQYISDKHRIKHCINTEKVALMLAKKHDVDLEKTAAAALLHDIGKCLTKSAQESFIKKYNLSVTKMERQSLDILHGHFGALMLKENGLDDDEIFNAVKNHTTGRKNMSKLEKIIFISDMIEPSRSYNGISKLRKLAKKDLDKAMLLSLKLTINSVLNREKQVHPNSIKLYNKLIESK